MKDEVQMMTPMPPPLVCEECGQTRHMVGDCPYNQALEEVNYASGKSIGYDPYSNTCNQGWRDHTDFSSKKQRDQRQGQIQNHKVCRLFHLQSQNQNKDPQYHGQRKLTGGLHVQKNRKNEDINVRE